MASVSGPTVGGEIGVTYRLGDRRLLGFARRSAALPYRPDMGLDLHVACFPRLRRRNHERCDVRTAAQ